MDYFSYILLTGKLFSVPVINIVQHFTLFIILMFVAEPDKVISTGLHQQIGQCNITETTFSITGAVSVSHHLELYPDQV